MRRLKRRDLLEILVKIAEENDRLREENTMLRTQLEERSIKLENAGSIAEAALRLSGIFKAAQDAANLYLEGVKNSIAIPRRAEAAKLL